jgi:hypothetical protein
MLAMLTTACPPHQEYEAQQRIFLRRPAEALSDLELGLLLPELCFGRSQV